MYGNIDIVGDLGYSKEGLMTMRERIIWADDSSIDTEGLDGFEYGEMLHEMSNVAITHPIIVMGQAGLWDGNHPVCTVIAPDTVADIVSRAPWNGMDSSEWLIDEHGDLRYTGIHHDGENTVVFRELKSDRIPNLKSGDEVLRSKSVSLGRRINRMSNR